MAVVAALLAVASALGADPTPAPSGAGNVIGDGKVDWGLYPLVLLGVVISIVIPAARKAAPKVSAGPRDVWTEFLTVLRPYLPWAVLSVAASVAIMFLAEGQIGTEVGAFVAGYGWDSTVQKFTGKP